MQHVGSTSVTAHSCLLFFPQGPVLLHCGCEILWATHKELLCQSISTCCVSSLYQPLSFAWQHSSHSPSHHQKTKDYIVSCPQKLCLFCRICVPGGFMLATVLGCVCLGIASLIYLVVSWYLLLYQSPVRAGWIYSTLIKLLDEAGSGGPDGNKEIATRKGLFHYWYLCWNMALQLWNLTSQGCAWTLQKYVMW